MSEENTEPVIEAGTEDEVVETDELTNQVKKEEEPEAAVTSDEVTGGEEVKKAVEFKEAPVDLNEIVKSAVSQALAAFEAAKPAEPVEPAVDESSVKIAKAVESLGLSVEAIADRLSQLESATAVRKSQEPADELKKAKTSSWGGTFLGANEL